MTRLWILLFLTVIEGSFVRVQATGFIIIDEAHWPPGNARPDLPLPESHWPRVHSTHAFSPLELRNFEVKTDIREQLAVTRISQEFYNPNSERMEGNFVFPIPKGAHLDKFAMIIDGREVEAELLDAVKARAIYENVVRKLKDPALLEYAGRDVYKARIYPFEGHSKKRIELSYTQILKA